MLLTNQSGRTINLQASKAQAVIPDDDDDIAPAILYVGQAGDITAILADDTDSVLFKAVPIGVFPVIVKRVLSTGTTAAHLIALR